MTPTPKTNEEIARFIVDTECNGDDVVKDAILKAINTKDRECEAKLEALEQEHYKCHEAMVDTISEQDKKILELDARVEEARAEALLQAAEALSKDFIMSTDLKVMATLEKSQQRILSLIKKHH